MEISRRSFLSLPLAGFLASRIEFDGDKDFLRQMVLDVLADSRVAPGDNGPKGWPRKNTCGFPLVTPGRGGYPAFWVRDFSMATDSGLVPEKEIRDHLFLLASRQNGDEPRLLKSGAEIPPFAIPDHINFDGTAVFYPGTYSPGEDQGGGAWGTLPPADDHFEFVHIAFALREKSGSDKLLDEEVDGLRLIERLERAFRTPEVRNGAVWTSAKRRAVGFGFCDTVAMTGHMLVPSLLRLRAARELAAMTQDSKYRTIDREATLAVSKLFADEKSGWLIAATESCRQPDAWGTMMAIGMSTVEGDAYQNAVASAYESGKLSFEGAVRHVPTDGDFSKSTMWESCLAPLGRYQNGAYWHTATGLLYTVLKKVDAGLAQRLRDEYIAHLKKHDYRENGSDAGAPWECTGPDPKVRQNPAYLASVALPYAAFVR